MSSLGLTSLILISLLDSNSFWTRQEAHSQLAKMDIFALPQLMLCDKCPQSIECSVRIKRLMRRHNSTIISCMCNGKPPYIDSIPREGIEGLYTNSWDRDNVIRFYMWLARENSLAERLEKEKEICRDPKENWWPDRLAGRLWLEDLRMDGMDDETLMKIVRILQNRSDYYMRNFNTWPQ